MKTWPPGQEMAWIQPQFNVEVVRRKELSFPNKTCPWRGAAVSRKLGREAGGQASQFSLLFGALCDHVQAVVSFPTYNMNRFDYMKEKELSSSQAEARLVSWCGFWGPPLSQSLSLASSEPPCALPSFSWFHCCGWSVRRGFPQVSQLL